MRVTTPTARETTILHFVAWGYTNAEIAGRLALSVKTIESHKSNAMRKLKLSKRADVVRYAVAHGWLASDAAPDDAQRASNTQASSVSSSSSSYGDPDPTNP